MNHDDFYTTLAQVNPVLLLALLWDSRYLDNLRNEERRHRREDPDNGVFFWTKRRAAGYVLVLTLVICSSLCAAVLVLAGAVSDSTALRTVLTTGLVLTITTLTVRVWGEVRRNATPPNGN